MKISQQPFVVKVHELIDLVIPPKQNPFSDYDLKCIGKAALPRAIRNWEASGSSDFSKITIHLPSKKIETMDKEKASDRFYHYIESQLEENNASLSLFRKNLSRAFCNALIFLSCCMGLVTLLNSPSVLPNMPIIRSVLTEGFTVIGWVALWGPVELLINELGILRQEKWIYQKLFKATLEFIPDDSF